MPKIAISTTSFAEFDSSYLKKCQEAGFEVFINPYQRKITPEELAVFAKDAVGLIAGTETITREVLLKLPNLKVISRCGTGLDNVDLGAANELGIKVFNTPDASTSAVAELTLGLILALLRNINQMDRATKNGKWQKMMGALLCSKKVGIIGFGKIGKKVAALLEPFGCQVSYYDPFTKDCLLNLQRLPKEELLKWADIISIHASSKEVLLGKNEFQVMKKGSWLINVSRGALIDETALFESLKEGYLAGAALDVFKQEPYHGPLKELANVILTPHIGSYAKEARIVMESQAVDNLLSGLKEG